MSTSPSNTLWHNIRGNAFNLAITAIIAAAGLAVTYVISKPMIAENQRQAQIAALQQVMPSDYFDQSLLDHAFKLPQAQQLNQPESSQGFVARKHGHINGWILPATSRDGYSGDIHLLIGIDVQGNITGVRITAHKETPGLGDKVDYKKSTWVDSFIGANKDNRIWAVKKDAGDFDQFTGATITPRAVVNSVANTLNYFQQHQELLRQAALLGQQED